MGSYEVTLKVYISWECYLNLTIPGLHLDWRSQNIAIEFLIILEIFSLTQNSLAWTPENESELIKVCQIKQIPFTAVLKCITCHHCFC